MDVDPVGSLRFDLYDECGSGEVFCIVPSIQRKLFTMPIQVKLKHPNSSEIPAILRSGSCRVYFCSHEPNELRFMFMLIVIRLLGKCGCLFGQGYPVASMEGVSWLFRVRASQT